MTGPGHRVTTRAGARLDAPIVGTLDDDTWVFPGHGDDTTIGKERPSLPEWKARGW